MAFVYLAQYTTFNSIQEMDQHVEEHIQQHFFELTESERAIVYKLASHSLNYPGVCHLKASTIADNLEISTKTVYRAIKKLESLGIIKKQTTTKEKGGRGATSILFCRFNLKYVRAIMSLLGLFHYKKSITKLMLKKKHAKNL